MKNPFLLNKLFFFSLEKKNEFFSSCFDGITKRMEQYYFMLIYCTPLLSLYMHEIHPHNEFYKSIYKLSSAFVLLHYMTQNTFYVFLISLGCFYETLFSYNSMYLDFLYSSAFLLFIGTKTYELLYTMFDAPKENLEVPCFHPSTDCIG